MKPSSSDALRFQKGIPKVDQHASMEGYGIAERGPRARQGDSAAAVVVVRWRFG